AVPPRRRGCPCGLQWHGDRRDRHSFPTRRSSDLVIHHIDQNLHMALWLHSTTHYAKANQRFIIFSNKSRDNGIKRPFARLISIGDRKSTRLNSSHVKISYAVFCLKKKINRQIKRL